MRLIAKVASIKPTEEVQARVRLLACKARKAKEANFLDKYRCANLAA